MSLSIRPETGLIVTVPWGQANRHLEPFLKRHQGWILRQADRMAAIASRVPRRWPYGTTLPYRGEEHPVIVEPGARRSSVERTLEKTLLVRMRRPGLDGARRLLRRWYVSEASRRLAERTAVLGAMVGVTWRRLSVGDQRSRWGSCSATGNLRFNFRLVMAPPEVMDYVIVHELMHRLELSHSRRFWALVAAHCPHARPSRMWLKTYGPCLTL